MSKDAGNFLRKVVKFVSHPATDWAELDANPSDLRESEYAKAEIKAMIERKRRNDFVRKRELDMLRKIRREGLNPDNAMALGGSSNIDSESSRNTPNGGARPDIGVKAKIDAIEQQMVGASEIRRSGPMPLSPAAREQETTPASSPLPLQGADGYAATRPYQPADVRTQPPVLETEAQLGGADPAAARPATATGNDAPQRTAIHSPLNPSGFHVDVSEVTHDPELDEPVIAFANADFEQCERHLMGLIQPGADRHHHAETWMVLFDLYRALALQAKFDALAVSFVHQFGLSAPQWYSLPERVSAHLAAQAEAAAKTRGAKGKDRDADTPAPAPAPLAGEDAMPVAQTLEGWVAPPMLDADAVGRLRCEVLQLPRPWALDWAGIESVTPEAASLLAALLRGWAKESVAMTWIGSDRLLEVLRELSPAGNRDADPAMWMLRMEVLRLSNRPDQFDETAIDYCVTYELSPPSWEAPACQVRLLADAACTQTVTLSHIGDISTSFVESKLHDDVEFIQVASLELAGQLSGDIGETLTDLDGQLGATVAVNLNCEHLIRVDFIAAGDLLNWVLARVAENRTVTFVNPHRLVALFFGAMGITEHAKVKLQLV